MKARCRTCFERYTTMPVEQVRNSTKVAPDSVYIIPPNATLTINEGTWR